MPAAPAAPTNEPRRYIIIGGVAGGATAAARLRRVDEHSQIILLEKDEHVSFANCGLPYYVGGEIEDRDKLLITSPELLRERFCIDVRTFTEAIAIDREQKTVSTINHQTGDRQTLAYDKLILSPGASPLVPPLEGIDAVNVMTLRNVADVDRMKGWVDDHQPKRAVVVGGGYIGLEMAEQLVERGVGVTLVQKNAQVLTAMDREMAELLHQELRRNDIALRLKSEPQRIITDGETATAVRLEGGEEIACGLVVLGIGVSPNTQIATDAGLELGETRGIATDEFMRTSDPDIYAVGDAAEYRFAPLDRQMRVALAGPANRAGRVAATHAGLGSGDAMTPVMGSCVVRVVSLTAAQTGLSMSQAADAGVQATSVIVIHKQHVGYYPGAKPITLKLVYEPWGDGKVLGAQAIGEEGVARRIDIIATAMRFGATVRDLAGLDLCYAPPFGAAKDVVHMAAFSACNERDGLVAHLQPDADLSGYQVVDVRSQAEVDDNPLDDAPHAVHIPLDELRDRLGEIDRDRPTVVSCASGQRSYNAARVLKQNGFNEVFNLTGAAKMRALAIAAKARMPASSA